MLRIDIWSDIACPWCWVGKRRLEHALAAHGTAAELHWHAFELDPAAPKETPESYDYVARLASKYGVSRSEGQAMIDRMVATGATLDLDFRFDRIRPGNTFDAHRLLALAGRRGCQTTLGERLFRAYLHEGRSLGSEGTLVSLAAEAGLDADEAQGVLAGDLFAEEVREDERRAGTLGVTGVPFFVLGERYGVAGAQPVSVLRDVLARIEREQALPASPQAEACGPDGCAVPDAQG